MSAHLHIIRPASREAQDLLSERLSELSGLGYVLVYRDFPVNERLPFHSGSISDRLNQLQAALFDKKCRYIIAARGGYGCSDLLPLLDWDRLTSLVESPLVVGFSDISALQCALYAKLGWPSIHGPMPASTLWRQGGDTTDVDQLLQSIRTNRWQGSIQMQAYLPGATNISGTLFGGCFSVLTNLIGTPYFPRSLKDHILFFEDTGENPGRLLRFLNQWMQSGALTGVKAIVLGSFRDLGGDTGRYDYTIQEFAQRTELPIFSTPLFGHVSPNIPLPIGASAVIKGEASVSMRWELPLTINPALNHLEA